MPALEGKVALIAGGAGGLGQAFARALINEGVSVVLADRDPSVAQAAAALPAGRAHAITADLSHAADAERAAAEAVDAFGGLDILVNATGEWRRTTAEDAWDTAVDDFDAMFGANMVAPLLLTRAVAPALVARGGGDIVNISSHDVLPTVIAGTNRPDADLFNAAAWGLNGFTESWSKTLAANNIRVNALCIGPTDTPMLAQMSGGNGSPAAALAPEDVAGLLLELLAEGPSGRSGQNIGAWAGQPVTLGPAKAPHRQIFYND